MCGICGIIGKTDRQPLERMVAAMHHRGPDDCGIYHDDVIGMGMARLAIIDLSPAAHQPMASPDERVWIVYNGEVYNFQQERNLLEKAGYSFKSTSDTEVVLRMYEHYGDDFLTRLRGMFALAIYDRRRGPGRERILLARDQLGIKPLLYAWRGNRLVFGSEIKTLLASGLIEPHMDPEALRLLLTFGSVYQPRTMLQDVHSLLPAHRLVVENGHSRIERYWSFGVDRVEGLREKPYGELVNVVAQALDESVRMHMVSDVPVGAFLSGGVDSSLLTGFMARAAGKRINTFSVGFEAEGSNIDETDDAKRTAQFLGTHHSRVVMTGADMRQRLDHIIGGLDQPSVDGINSYFVSMAARQAATVAISGTGGDELFTGYPWFTQMVQYEQYLRQESGRERTIRHLGRAANWPLFNSLILGNRAEKLLAYRSASGFLTRYANTYQIFGVVGAARLLHPTLRSSAGVGQALVQDVAHLDQLPQSPAVERVSALCLGGYTGNQLLRDIDAMSMAHTLEVRVPFLDVPMVDLSLSLPVSAKLSNVDPTTQPYTASYRDLGSKKILVDAGIKEGVLREDIDLQPKRGFGLPLDAWLKADLFEVMQETLSAEVVRSRGLLAPDEVGAVKEAFIDGREHWSRPWLLMVLELWCREFLDK
jgi:asparagine synthase (glutamine-hydrolysing)